MCAFQVERIFLRLVHVHKAEFRKAELSRMVWNSQNFNDDMGYRRTLFRN